MCAETRDEPKPQADCHEALLIEYQQAQDSAQHHDNLAWTVTSIMWAANLVLLGVVVNSSSAIAQVSTRILLTLLSVLGILSAHYACRLYHLLAEVKRRKYARCHKLEEMLGMRQHRDLEIPPGVMWDFHNGARWLFIAIWIVVDGAIWLCPQGACGKTPRRTPTSVSQDARLTPAFPERATTPGSAK